MSAGRKRNAGCVYGLPYAFEKRLLRVRGGIILKCKFSYTFIMFTLLNLCGANSIATCAYAFRSAFICKFARTPRLHLIT